MAPREDSCTVETVFMIVLEGHSKKDTSVSLKFFNRSTSTFHFEVFLFVCFFVLFLLKAGLFLLLLFVLVNIADFME